MDRSLYDILGVAPAASAETIKAAYVRLIKRHHPDNAGPQGLRLSQEINAAYAVLGDPQRRAAYDADIRRAAEPPRQARGGSHPSATSSQAPSPSGNPPFGRMLPAFAGAVA